MANIFVDVFVPGNGKTYEFRIDDTITTSEAKKWMSSAILQLEERGITFHTHLFLCDLTAEPRRILPDNVPLSTAHVKSGNKLMLV